MQNSLRFILLGILAIIWGSSFILMKEGLKELSAIQVAGIRLIVAGVAMLPFIFKYLKQVTARDIGPLLIVSFLGNGLPYFLFAYAETRMGSAITGMLNSLVPMFTLLIAVLVFKTPVSRLKVYGVIIGLIGAFVLLMGASEDTSGDYFYGGLVIAATICYGISVNTLKARLSHFHPLATAAIPLAITLLPTIIYLPLVEPIDVLNLSEQGVYSVGAIVILGLVGTALAMILFNRIIQLSSAVFASSVTYLIPIVALFWGVVAGENIKMLHFVGLIIVLAAIYLINKKDKAVPAKNSLS